MHRGAWILLGLFLWSGTGEARIGHGRHRHRHHRPTCLVPYEPRDLMIRTTLGEARGQPLDGQIAVAAVIRNRMLSGKFGQSIREIVIAEAQFEPWVRRRCELTRYNDRTPGWSQAEKSVDAALSGNDPTNGALFFAEISVVKKRRNWRALAWIEQLINPVMIGDHTFGRLR
jgi:N-acetylmuramoyl-L-alanine amidase